MDSQPTSGTVQKVNWWKYFAIIGWVLVGIMYVSVKEVNIPSWVWIIGFAALFGKTIIEYFNERRIYLTENEMVKMAVKEAGKRHVILNDDYKNTHCQPIGLNQFALHFVQEDYTYLFDHGRIVSKSRLSPAEMKQDIERFIIQNELAKRGVGE